ncbi:MAG: hypothetical protein GIX03_04030 [Candidatus Eremiobacteraeota bacterium]|nr:hypothetical protein [Candidatus Eremiobacteraeota bacterium]MBC5802176.1 hypothetical protein [Candidatus Eremiobacteraeota bacterium]MBC5821277.1 hypothetical protein [Candidatus Eremiobacteraeota bacterium]
MDTVTAPQKRLSRRIPGVGTPYRIEQRRRRIEKFLRHEAAALRSTAAQLDTLARRLERDREAGLDADRADLIRAARGSAGARGCISELLGLKKYTLDECIDAIFPRLAAPRDSGVAFHRDEEYEPSAQPTQGSTPDVISEAMAIAQSAATDASRPPDWSRAPLTECERRIRVKLLEHAEEDVANGRWSSSVYEDLGAKPRDGRHHVMLNDDCDHLYDDILASWRRAQAIEARQHADFKADSRRQAFDDAIAAVDEEGDAPTDS